jgi:hypothetical protein
MARRPLAALVAALLLAMSCAAPPPARADNPMGYRLMEPDEASRLPRAGGTLGMDVDRAQRVDEGGMTFDLMRVRQVRRGTPAARAGLDVGDTIIAVDGRVFPTIAAFASYIGSTPPGQQISIDYIPKGGGPQQAQRVAVAVGGPGGKAAPVSGQQAEEQEKAGMSTGAKLAIAAAAAAVIGCYWKGCFSRDSGAAGSAARP